MEKLRLGRTDLTIAPLVFGGNVFGWTADEKTSFALLDAFFDAGFNAIDTADVYHDGKSEEVVGRGIKASRDRGFHRVRTVHRQTRTRIRSAQRPLGRSRQDRMWAARMTVTETPSVPATPGVAAAQTVIVAP